MNDRACRRIACLVGGDPPARLELARAFSPWVEVSADGAAIWLDVRGCAALHHGEEGLAAALVAGARRAGWTVRVGIAGSKGVARLAAEQGRGHDEPEEGRERGPVRTLEQTSEHVAATAHVHAAPAAAAARACVAGEGWVVVRPGRDREAVAGLPVAALRLSREAAETFRRWGLGTLGRLAALPRAEVALRLGAAGARWRDLAAGDDDEPLVPTPQPDEPEERVDLEYPLYEVEPLLFALRGALDRVAARLASRGAVFGAVALRLRLESGAADDRSLALAAPLRDVPAILALLRVSIESSPPAAAVTGLTVRGIPAAARSSQLSLFEPAGPAPQQFAVTLARLAALVGRERVGTPRVPDAHRSAAPLALRLLRSPLAARWDGRRLETDDPRLRGAAVRVSGPWKLRGGWWSERPFERDYYDVELSGGALLRLFRDVSTAAWFVDGIYD